MDGETEDQGFDARMNAVLEAVEPKEDEETSGNENAAESPDAVGNTEPPLKDAIGEGKEKTNGLEVTEPKPDAKVSAIDPPASWPSDDKESFKALPTWAQEVISRRENDREATFSQRSRTVAEKERVLSETQNKTTEAQTRYLGELERLNNVAAQLMPAKFADIKTEADYLKMKVDNPARASEYEAFVQVLRNSNMQANAARQAQQQQKLDAEWTSLQDKWPEFKDPVKGPAIINDVRKTLVENYGFNPNEVQIIADHRHVQIVRDAMAWRQYQSNIRAAEAKKVAPQQPGRTLRPTANTGSSLSGDQKAQTLNRVRKTGDIRAKADLIASLI